MSYQVKSDDLEREVRSAANTHDFNMRVNALLAAERNRVLEEAANLAARFHSGGEAAVAIRRRKNKGIT